MADFPLNSEHVRRPYNLTDIKSVISWESGWVHMPIAEDDSNGKQVSIPVKIHAGFGRRVVTFHIQRIGEQPKVPSPDPGPNEVLLSASIVTESPGSQANATTPLHIVKGTYIFALFQPVFHTDGIPGPTSPWTSTPAAVNKLPANNFDPNLTSGGGGDGGPSKQ